MQESVGDEVALAIIAGAFAIQASAVENVQRGAKTGIVYDKGKGITHQASAPGESPASDTGNLASRLLSNKAVEFTNGNLEATIGIHNLSATPYARRLELGDVFGPLAAGVGRIQARPYMRPAYDTNIKQITKDIADATKKGTDV